MGPGRVASAGRGRSVSVASHTRTLRPPPSQPSKESRRAWLPVFFPEGKPGKRGPNRCPETHLGDGFLAGER